MDAINITILLADDDQDFLYQTKLKVENMGFNTVTASSQKEAEKLLDNIKPDLAIFDLMMENEDSGFILSYRIKKKYPDVPVILATAVKSQTGRNFGITSEVDKRWIKADRYLDKDIRPDQLEREIKALLKL
jgi:CheY-like chemotaxis protein